MTQHIFPFLSERQNNQYNEVAPSSPNFSVSEKLARYGTPSDADMRLTRRLAEGARLLQIQMLDHVIVGAGAEGRLGYFSFKETGLC
jgi:RadC-like JAB domain-containing protein